MIALILVEAVVIVGLAVLLVFGWLSRARARAGRDTLAQTAADVLLAEDGAQLRIRLREVRFALLHLDCAGMPRWILAMVRGVRDHARYGLGASERIPDHLPRPTMPPRSCVEVRPPILPGATLDTRSGS